MRFFKALSFALILMLGSSSVAQAIPLQPGTCARRISAERCSENLDRVFERGFFDDAIYSPLACNTNILALVKKLARNRFNLSRFNVFYIGAVEPFEERYLTSGKKIHAFASREGEITWNFHVVLETNGYILDLDYSNEPEIVPVEDYLRDMFAPDSNTTIGIRSIRADEYARDYSDALRPHSLDIRNWAYYLYDADARFPARLISDYL